MEGYFKDIHEKAQLHHGQNDTGLDSTEIPFIKCIDHKKAMMEAGKGGGAKVRRARGGQFHSK